MATHNPARRSKAVAANPDPAAFGVTGDDMEARRQQRLKTVALVKSGRTPLQVIQVGEEANQIAAQGLAVALTREPPRRPLACAEGCAWCCHKRVGVGVPEVARISAFVNERLDEPARARLAARLQLAFEKRTLRRQKDAAMTPCPLLEDNRCMAYPVRPLTCQGFNSSDAERCRASVEFDKRTVVPIYPPQLRLMTMVLDGMCAGLKESRLGGEVLELAAALQIALTVPDAIDRWLGGEPVFAPARLPQS
jgi:Fe-S-cluster containining protein